MTKQTINVGLSPNDQFGDSIRTAFLKVNSNFAELYTTLGEDLSADLTVQNNIELSGTAVLSGTAIISTAVPLTKQGANGDIAGMVAVDSNYLYVCTATWVNTSPSVQPDIWTRTQLSAW